ncbi:MAG: undecaprenyl-phosphate glucose phosphotransferase, partial [Aquaticitalea sp.]
MSLFKQGRYSGYLRPISYLIDLGIINGLAILYYFKNIDPVVFIGLMTLAWVMLSIFSKFYEVYRFTREVTILSLTIRQMVLFTLVVFAFSGYNQELNIYPLTILKYVMLAFFLIAVFKFALYYLLQKYRTSFGGNYRKTVIIGANKKTLALQDFFNKYPEYGYIHKRTFSFREKREI